MLGPERVLSLIRARETVIRARESNRQLFEPERVLSLIRARKSQLLGLERVVDSYLGQRAYCHLLGPKKVSYWG